jgi:hypothetical protein
VCGNEKLRVLKPETLKKNLPQNNPDSSIDFSKFFESDDPDCSMTTYELEYTGQSANTD